MNKVMVYSERVKQLTMEIKSYQDDVCQGMIEIGERLIEIKKELGHGNWLPYIDMELKYSRKTASTLMKVAKVFRNFDANRVQSLSQTMIMEILCLPEEDREYVLSTYGEDLSSMSIRDFKKKISSTKKGNKQQRKQIPSITLKQIAIRSNGKCEICGWGNEHLVGVLHPHHIEQYSETQDNSIDNLVMCCPNCHNIIHTVNNCNDLTIRNGILRSLEENTYRNIIEYIK